jgi:hypothetical protein
LIVLVSGTALCVASEVAALREDDELGGVLMIVTAWSQVLFLLLNLCAEWAEGDGSHRRRLVELRNEGVFSDQLNTLPINVVGVRDGKVRQRQDQQLSVASELRRRPIPRTLSAGNCDVVRRSRPEVFLELAIREICNRNGHHRSSNGY